MEKKEMLDGKGVRPHILKEQNRRLILNELYKNNTMSISEISNSLNLTRQTVTKAIENFYGMGLVESVGKGNSTVVGGKKPEMFTFCPDFHNVYIYTLIEQSTIFLINLKGEVIGTRIVGKGIGCDNFDELIETIAIEYSEMLKHNNQAGDLYGVSISTAGIVDEESGILRFNVCAPKWGFDIPILDKLKRTFKAKEYVVENIARMTGRALIMDEDMDEPMRIATMFTSKGGVSSCFIADKQVVSGKHSLVGETGHMAIDPSDEELCACGCQGCFERMIDIKRVQAKVARAISDGEQTILKDMDPVEIGLKDIFEGSAKGDAVCQETVDYLARMFSIVVKNIYITFDPQRLVFQGDYAFADAHFDEKLKEYLNHFRYYPRNKNVETKYDKRDICSLAVVGASQILIKRFLGDDNLYV